MPSACHAGGLPRRCGRPPLAHVHPAPPVMLKHLPRLSRKPESELGESGPRHMPWENRPLRPAASNFARNWRHALPALAGAGAALIVGAATLPTAEAKSPGTRYCFHGLCHRVGTLAQTDTLVGWRGYLLASYYDSCRLD